MPMKPSLSGATTLRAKMSRSEPQAPICARQPVEAARVD